MFSFLNHVNFSTSIDPASARLSSNVCTINFAQRWGEGGGGTSQGKQHSGLAMKVLGSLALITILRIFTRFDSVNQFYNTRIPAGLWLNVGDF